MTPTEFVEDDLQTQNMGISFLTMDNQDPLGQESTTKRQELVVETHEQATETQELGHETQEPTIETQEPATKTCEC